MTSSNSLNFAMLLGVTALVVILLAVAYTNRKRDAVANAEPPQPAALYPHFVFVKILDPVTPLERGTKYEDPLSDSLAAAKVGEVTGGGAQLDKENKIE